MYHHKFKFIYIVGISALLSLSIFAQSFSGAQFKDAGVPHFEAKIFSTFSSEKGKPLARVFIQIANGYLTFVKHQTGFRARLQIEVLLKRKNDEFVFSKTMAQDVLVNNYNDTNTNNIINTFVLDIPIKSGKYEATIIASDRLNDKEVERKASFSFPPPAVSDSLFRVSDILLFSHLEIDSSGTIVNCYPALTNQFTDQKGFIYAYINTYSELENHGLLVKYLVKDDQGRIVQQNQYLVNSSKFKFLEHFIRLNRYYLNRQKYKIEVVVSGNNQSVEKEAIFEFFWKAVPVSIQNLAAAIRQLRYITSRDSINHYLKASYDEQKAFFQRFWTIQDPNPEIPGNELMREYYRRIEYGNQRFSVSGREGWLTDRGRIYAKFGEPDDVERHPFEMRSSAYEVWQYYTLRKTFLFIDRSGFGDYILHPSYHNVEYE